MTLDKPTPDNFGQFAPSGWCLNPGHVRLFGGFLAPDPRPGSGTDHAVTHDVIVSDDGTVTVELNGCPLDDVPHGPSSHIP